MRDIVNRLEQCRSILAELRRTNPGVTLPGGVYAAKDRPLDRACLFLERELEGMIADAKVDPAAGDPQSSRALVPK